jgi:mannose-6-phosphate isomerase class I
LVVKLTHQIIGSKRLIVITDANPGKGMGDGEFEFGGKQCISKDGKSYTKDTGRIAGSTIGMIHGFKNIMAYTGCSLEEAVEMCSVNPAKLLKLDQMGRLEPGCFADFTILDDHYDVVSTYRDGTVIYDRHAEKKLYRIQPVFNYRVWGGNRLKEKYGYVSDLPNIGECYNVIAMKDHLDCTVIETNEKLSEFYQSHTSLFQSHTEFMPVRTAMANPIVPMSIQLHPNDEYAMKHEGRKGKPDGVYFIEGKGTMVLGHYATSLEEFKAKVLANDYEHLVKTIKVKAGEFVDVPFGTLHAFGGGLTLIEFTQNADLTYRLYDYDRIDPILGTKRQLHIQEVFDNIRIPNSDTKTADLKPIDENGLIRTMLHDEPGVYTAEKLEVQTKAGFRLDEFYFLTILEGQGQINALPVKAGETVFVPCAFGKVTFEGTMQMAYVTYKEGGHL